MNHFLKKPGFALLVFLYTNLFSMAQPFDTLKVMSYNLTNYGNNITNQCTTQNNGLTLKNPEFKTILKYVMPDILGACEVNTNPSIGTNFLNNVLNTDGVTYYKKSNYQSEPSGTLSSVLFYNSEKLVLAFQSYAITQYRLTHHFRLYLKTEGLASGDTIWINVLACHLKAGNTSPDAADRATMAATIRTYLANFPKNENCLILGDFNVYRSSEVAFQNLTAAGTRPTYQFLDPVNRVGSWGTNSSYADVHTQCPSNGYNTACYSGGGLDDRFDFILMNRHMLYDSAGLRYITGTYKAVGNDGQHYNKSITDSPTNNSAPSAVLTSLYKASDHLPVVAKLRVSGSFITGNEKRVASSKFGLEYANGSLLVEGLPDGEKVNLVFSDVSGRILWQGEKEVRESVIGLPVIRLNKGLIFIRALSETRKPAFTRYFFQNSPN